MLTYQYNYDNIFWENDTIGGFRQTTMTKPLLVKNLSLLLEKFNIILRDIQTIQQLEAYEKKGVKYNASYGHDDDVTSILAGILFTILLHEDMILQIIGNSNINSNKLELNKSLTSISNKDNSLNTEDYSLELSLKMAKQVINNIAIDVLSDKEFSDKVNMTRKTNFNDDDFDIFRM